MRQQEAKPQLARLQSLIKSKIKSKPDSEQHKDCVWPHHGVAGPKSSRPTHLQNSAPAPAWTTRKKQSTVVYALSPRGFRMGGGTLSSGGVVRQE